VNLPIVAVVNVAAPALVMGPVAWSGIKSASPAVAKTRVPAASSMATRPGLGSGICPVTAAVAPSSWAM
jgi:hypothetical protein